ncbi:acyl carrier protein [Rhizocola hellebori]|uniref:acyl carrier protein n=1 Tax=Rhizocola hellebori TaxID=1392758 RepID=UPI001943B8FD|nr:acyl carrier protein [Rhizocola hellebori]
MVIEILARHTGLAPEEITPSLYVRDDLGLDSIDAAEIMLVLEKRTGRRCEVDEARTINTVSDIIATISSGSTA